MGLYVKNDYIVLHNTRTNWLRVLTSGDRDTTKFGNYSFGPVGGEDEAFLSFCRIESAAYFCSNISFRVFKAVAGES